MLTNGKCGISDTRLSIGGSLFFLVGWFNSNGVGSLPEIYSHNSRKIQSKIKIDWKKNTMHDRKNSVPEKKKQQRNKHTLPTQERVERE